MEDGRIMQDTWDMADGGAGDDLGFWGAETVSLDDPANAWVAQLRGAWDDDPLEACLQAEDRERLRRYIERIPDRERRLVELHFGFADGRCHSLQEIAQEFGVSQERVRQLIYKYVCRHRPQRRNPRLKDYLEE